VDAEVTGPQPGGVARGSVGVAARRQAALQLVAEDPLGLFGATPVTLSNVVAVQPDFADFTIGRFRLGLGVDDDAPLAAGDPAARHRRDGAGRVTRDLNRATGSQ